MMDQSRNVIAVVGRVGREGEVLGTAGGRMTKQPRRNLPSLALSLFVLSALGTVVSILGTRGVSSSTAAVWGGLSSFPSSSSSSSSSSSFYLPSLANDWDDGPPSSRPSATVVRDSLHRGTDSRVAAAPDDVDADCPFRTSSLYRSIYVYPTYNDTSSGWTRTSPALSDRGRSGLSDPWPWIDTDVRTKADGTGHYDVTSQMAQYTLELIVRDIITHPRSCLRSDDPDSAKLFYVPYLPSTEFHLGRMFPVDESYRTSPFARAIHDAIEGSYGRWEDTFGLTSNYWKRRNGSDHILVFSEPLHGLGHPRNRRGNYHYIETQRQLRPPIVLSVELSKTFVSMYPLCASKNVVMPYPNPDGRWFNGHFDNEADKILRDKFGMDKRPGLGGGGDDHTNNGGGGGAPQMGAAALPAEKELANAKHTNASVAHSDRVRPLAHHYSAGRHGTCRSLRIALSSDLRCSASATVARSIGMHKSHYAIPMRLSTFCPCPGGDSPGAKRMFDSILAGCVPIVLSEDFVWPFTKEADVASTKDASSFSLRWNATYWTDKRFNDECHPIASTKDANANKTVKVIDGGFHGAMENITSFELKQLKNGLEYAKNLYAYYEFSANGNIPDNPLREGVLPRGGAARELVKALEERAYGRRWKACEEELKMIDEKAKESGMKRYEPKKFLC